MKFAGYVRISASGPGRKALKSTISLELARLGFRRTKHDFYFRNEIDAGTCRQVQESINMIEDSFKGTAVVRELWISSGYNVHILVRKPVFQVSPS